MYQTDLTTETTCNLCGRQVIVSRDDRICPYCEAFAGAERSPLLRRVLVGGAVAAFLILWAVSASAEIIRDRRNDLDLSATHLNVLVNEYETGGHPTTWYALDGAISPYAPEATRLSLGAALYPGQGRQTFWVPKEQPTFYLLGYNPPYPLTYGFRGLTFHDLSTEANGGAGLVTLTPGAAGVFNYNSTAGSRDVVLSVMLPTPEPSGLLLAIIGGLALIRLNRLSS